MNKYRVLVSSLASDYYKPRKRKHIATAKVEVWANGLTEACEYAKRKFFKPWLYACRSQSGVGHLADTFSKAARRGSR